MSFFKNLGDSINRTAKGAVEKTKDLSEIAKLNTEISKIKSAIEVEYSKIGKESYEAYANGAENTNLAESLELIKDSFAKIDDIEANILVLKGITICPSCGAELDMVCAFCGTCGTKIER